MQIPPTVRIVLDIVAIYCANSEMILAISAAMRAKLNLVNSKTYISLAVDAACVEMQYIFDRYRSESTFLCWITINMPPILPSIDSDTQREHWRPNAVKIFVQHYNIIAQKSFFYANHPKQDQCLRNLCFMNILYPSIKSTMFRQLINKADERHCIRSSPYVYHAGYEWHSDRHLIYFMKWGEYVLTNKARLSDHYWFAFTKEQRAAIDKVIFSYWPN